MGTICILFGLIILICSLGLGFAGANYFLASPLRITFTSLLPGTVEVYAVFVGICGFIGLLICLNLVMHGLTYNKVVKLSRRHKKR